MGRLAWSQLRFRTTRAIALLVGLLLATTAFTVLTAASRTAQLRTVGTVTAHFKPAYDILVRPEGARTALETQTGTVQPNFLSGIYGGITMAQYHDIAQIPGVQVAAPIAMVGYALLTSQLSFPLPAADLSRPGRQLYRVTTTWTSQDGTSRVTQPPSYLYITPQRLELPKGLHIIGAAGSITQTVNQTERGPDGKSVAICPGNAALSPGGDPFGVAAQSDCTAWSKVNGYGPGRDFSRANPRYDVSWVIPVLIAAVDPVAEAKLDGLNHAVISGHYLPEDTRDAGGTGTFPVLASSVSGLDESAVTQLAALTAPASPPSMTVPWMTRRVTASSQVISTSTTTARQAYQQLLAALAVKGSAGPAVGGTVMYAGKNQSNGPVGVEAYWSVGPTSYRRSRSGALIAQLTYNPASAWYAGGAQDVSMDDEDNQYRKVSVHAPALSTFTSVAASPQLAGIFNPAKIKAFDPLSAVPLGAYEPVVAAPATAASRKALHGRDLLPNANLGGYVSQPVDLITSLSALPALQNQGYYGSGVHARDPISVIRVRVAGVTGPNPVSLARIREVAQQIEVRTHLDVDIVAGSSPSPTTIDLPAGKFGQPALTLSEDWVKKGVAVAILTAIDKNSLVLFVLILIVCVLFVANSASAAIRARRRELGVLACLGWTRPRLFTAVLGELAAIGLAAGLAGAAAALPLSSALGLHASPGRAALAVPIAVAVALLAGLAPAWLAASAEPVASVRPPVLAVRRARQPGGITALAAVNVLRTPGRALVGAISLAIGVTALTILAALTFAFRGVLVGSLLGNAVAVQVRGVDYVAVIATVALGVLAVADVVFLNIRERAPELATLRAFGWSESALGRLVITEGTLIGLTGSLAGAALGLAAAASFAGQLPAALYLIAAAAVTTGVLVTTGSALLPAQALRHLPAAHLLAEE
ncbi:MAG TPA: FtsX-like permease family protein [Streptosporangiaceae bacterium]|nr:FtsX-like permease family protein [Streptosporangiaceae bacterium]